jgi:hypothetical protein
MSWDWSSPIALGLFILMCGGAVLLLGIGAAIASSGARWMNPSSRGRR